MREPNKVRVVRISLTPEQEELLETAREIVRINGLQTNNKSVITIALKSFVESQQQILKNQYQFKEIRTL